MELFLDGVVECVSRGKRPVLKDIAEAMGIDKTRPSKWNRIPEFRAALSLTLREACDWLMEAAHVAQTQVAIAGSLPHYETQLRRRGLERPASVTSGDPQPSAPGALAIAGTHIHIHGIPEPASRTTLPPPVELPASATAVLSQPK